MGRQARLVRHGFARRAMGGSVGQGSEERWHRQKDRPGRVDIRQVQVGGHQLYLFDAFDALESAADPKTVL